MPDLNSTQEQRAFMNQHMLVHSPVQNGDHPERNIQAPLSTARGILGTVRSSQT